MEKSRINKIDTDVVLELVVKAWDLIRFNYPLTLGLMSLLIISVMIGFIPFIGVLIAAVIGSVIPMMFYKACHFWENEKPGQFSEIMQIFNNKPLMNKMIPLLAINIAVSAGPQILMMTKVYQGYTLSMLLTPINMILGVTIPILFFQYEKVDFVKALGLAIQGIMTNIIPFIVGFIIMTAISIFSIVACLLPFVFVGFPMILAYSYFWYRVVYEDLVIDVKDEGII